MTDLQIIKQIEQELNVKLKKVNEIDWNTKGYMLIGQKNVKKFSFYNCEITDLNRIIKPLKDFNNPLYTKLEDSIKKVYLGTLIMLYTKKIFLKF